MDENDYSAITIGSFTNGYRMMLCSGWGRPLRIEIEKCDKKAGWYKIGEYNPKYCPNCDRKIAEYDKSWFHILYQSFHIKGGFR